MSDAVESGGCVVISVCFWGDVGCGGRVTLFSSNYSSIPSLVLKSIVDDFNMEPGTVSMKVVFVLRSAEV